MCAPSSDRLADTAHALQAMGIGVVAIMPKRYETLAGRFLREHESVCREHKFTFPYVIDETQGRRACLSRRVHARFLRLQFEGRAAISRTAGRIQDHAWSRTRAAELYEAMKLVAQTGHGPKDQIPSMGCSIKWRG